MDPNMILMPILIHVLVLGCWYLYFR